MRLLVCGGRDYADREAAFAALDKAHSHRPISLVIHGAYRGADALAKAWAKSRGVPDKPFPAPWKKHGPAAGPIRNQHMLDEGALDGCLAFPGGDGTADMVRRCQAAGVKVWRPYG